MNSQTCPKLGRNELAFLGAFALLKILIQLPFLTRYGYHHDELYFLACGQHLAFGYVDHSPIVPWIARLADTLFEQSLFGLRIFSLLAGAFAVFLTGLLTRRLGGGRFAQAVACLSMIIAPVYLRTNYMFCIPAFEEPVWILGCFLLLRIIQEDKPRLWLCVGLVTGIGLMIKHSTLFFGFGLLAALVLTEQRKNFKSPWLYAGGGLAVLVFLPNILWQISNGWPTVQFLRHLNEGTMSGISAAQFIVGQVLYLSPFTAPIWIGGLLFYFSRSGRPYRAFGWFYLSLFVLLLAIKSKIYYLAPAYPVLLAGGAFVLENVIRNRGWDRLRHATVATLAVGGMVFLPIALPVFSIDRMERFITAVTFGGFKNVYELTGDLHGMFGWKERVALIADVYNRMSPEERKRTVILAGWYGPAGAVDYFGAAYGLPRAVSGHMTYYLWGLPEGPIDTVIAINVRRSTLKEFFDDISVGGETELDNVRPNERRFVVLLCRKPKVELHSAWPRIRDYGF